MLERAISCSTVPRNPHEERNHASTAWVPAVVGQAEVATQPGLAHSDEKIVRPSATTYAFSFIRASKFPEYSVHQIAARLWGNPIQRERNTPVEPSECPRGCVTEILQGNDRLAEKAEIVTSCAVSTRTWLSSLISWTRVPAC
jgi:hypothetical protein